MEHDDLAVGGHVEVELEGVHAEGQRLPEGQQAIFRPEGGAATVRGNEDCRP